jgi:hypothetical protein
MQALKLGRWLIPLLLLPFATSAARADESADCVTEMGNLNLDALVQKDTEDLTPCVDALRTKKLDERTVDQQRTLAHLEKALRKKGDALEDAIAGEQKTSKANQQLGASATDSSTNADELNKIKAAVIFSKQDKLVSGEKYDDFFFRLNTGYEFVAIDKFFDKGEPRVSLLMNRLFGGELVTDDRHGFWYGYGGRSNFSAILESSAEATVKLPDNQTATPAQASATDNNATSTNANVTKAFTFELQGTWIFYRSRPLSANNLRDHIGLIVAAGGLKTDDQPKITSRFYYGIRAAVNPELYADIMYGHTSGLHSNRLEVRGQFPVMSLSNGDRIFLGGIGNFALNKRQRTPVLDSQGHQVAPPESDTIRAYISWNTDFKNLFSKNQS